MTVPSNPITWVPQEKTFSVVSAVSIDRIDYLDETAQSLLDQEIPDGWDLQWCLQFDGSSPPPYAAWESTDDRVEIGSNGESYGAAITRNLAAARARGELYMVLDGDDLVLPGRIARTIEIMDRNPAVEWVVTSVHDLLPGGERVSFTDPEPGPIERFSVFKYWSRFRTLPVHPATLTVRANTFWRAGGWAALSTSEDTSLVMALDAAGNGYFDPEPGLLYRKWPGQITRTMSNPTKELREQEIIRRATALRRHHR